MRRFRLSADLDALWDALLGVAASMYILGFVAALQFALGKLLYSEGGSRERYAPERPDEPAPGSVVAYGMATQDPLARYRAKRDFGRTAEPEGGAARRRKAAAGARAPRPFVVQKHDARRLHYDLRLELGGVLRSWAVTRGPSLDPADKRLAVEVEDHPLDYAGFEGVIAEGYGAGTVMVWDAGTWEPAPEMDDPAEALARGNLKFVLRGERLRGGWDLVRMKPRPKERQPQWLLIKRRDEEAAPGDGERLVRDAVTSVQSRRTMEEIASGKAPTKEGRARTAAGRAGAEGARAPAKTAAAADAAKRRPAPLAGLSRRCSAPWWSARRRARAGCMR